MLKNALFIFVITFVILAYFLPSFSKKHELVEKNRQLEQRIKELELQKQALSEENRLLEEDPVYLERVAREKMGILKNGEVVYRLSPDETVEGR